VREDLTRREIIALEILVFFIATPPFNGVDPMDKKDVIRLSVMVADEFIASLEDKE